MSISSEITRLQNAKSSLKTAINSKLIDNKITNETIDDYADKVDEIVVPNTKISKGIASSEIQKGDVVFSLYYDVLKGNDISFEKCVKLDSSHFLLQKTSYSSSKVTLSLYQENGFGVPIEIETVSKTLTRSGGNIHIDRLSSDGDYYYIESLHDGKLRYVAVTDLENIYIIENDTQGSSGDPNYTTLKINENTYFCKRYTSNTDKTTYKFVTINYDGENTSFSSTQEAELNGALGFEMVGKNRLVSIGGGTVGDKQIYEITLYDTSNNTLNELCSSEFEINEDWYSDRSYSNLGKIYIAWVNYNQEGLTKDVVYCFNITDSSITQEQNTISGKDIRPCTFDFKENKILEYKLIFGFNNDGLNYTYWYSGDSIYSFSGYEKTFISEVPNFCFSPTEYNQLLQKTNDNLIFFSSGYYDYFWDTLVFFKDDFSGTPYGKITNDITYEYNGFYYMYNMSIGIAAEDGDQDDEIKFYALNV